MELNISAFPPVLCDWVINGLGMSSLVYTTGHIKDPVPLIEKRRGLSPGGRFPPSFIHQVIITGLNKLYNCVSRPEDGLRCRQGVKPPLKLQKRPALHSVLLLTASLSCGSLRPTASTIPSSHLLLCLPCLYFISYPMVHTIHTRDLHTGAYYTFYRIIHKRVNPII